MKITKREWDEFWCCIGDGWYYENDDVPEDYWKLKDDEVFAFTFGTILWGGNGKMADPSGILAVPKEYDESPEFDLPRSIRKWQKTKTHVVVSIEIGRDKVGELLVYTKTLGGKRI